MRVSERPSIATAGALKASGHTYRTLREEIRANLLAKLASGEIVDDEAQAVIKN